MPLTRYGRTLPVQVWGKEKTGRARVVALRVRDSHGGWGLQAMGHLPADTVIGTLRLLPPHRKGWCGATVKVRTRWFAIGPPSHTHMGVLMNSPPPGMGKMANCRFSHSSLQPDNLTIKTRRRVRHGEPLLVCYGTRHGCEEWTLQAPKRTGGKGRGWLSLKAKAQRRVGNRFG